MSLVDKFQITVPAKIEGSKKFATFDSARVNNHVPDCGMPQDNINDSVTDDMKLTLAGKSDVSKDTNVNIVNKGYSRKGMKGSDDQYSGEHIDLFYGEVQGDSGEVGFVERNNYLDRM